MNPPHLQVKSLRLEEEMWATTSRPPTSDEIAKNDTRFKRVGNDYWQFATGTSFAAPHCAASVAILLMYIHLQIERILLSLTVLSMTSTTVYDIAAIVTFLL